MLPGEFLSVVSDKKSNPSERIVLAVADGSAFLRVEQVAQIFNVGKQSIYNQWSSGRFPVRPIKLGGRLRWPVDDVVAYLKSQQRIS